MGKPHPELLCSLSLSESSYVRERQEELKQTLLPQAFFFLYSGGSEQKCLGYGMTRYQDTGPAGCSRAHCFIELSICLPQAHVLPGVTLPCLSHQNEGHGLWMKNTAFKMHIHLLSTVNSLIIE